MKNFIRSVLVITLVAILGCVFTDTPAFALGPPQSTTVQLDKHYVDLPLTRILVGFEYPDKYCRYSFLDLEIKDNVLKAHVDQFRPRSCKKMKGMYTSESCAYALIDGVRLDMRIEEGEYGEGTDIQFYWDNTRIIGICLKPEEGVHGPIPKVAVERR